MAHHARSCTLVLVLVALAGPWPPTTAAEGAPTAPVANAELSAREIVERVHAAAGGQAWLAAGTNVMSGHATLCSEGS